MYVHALPSLLFATLGIVLMLAVWHDVRSRRIPNYVVFPGALLALILQSTLPNGAGLFVAPFGGLGLLAALTGLGAGLAFLLPMYALRAMGAGDVKLMAMIGAFVGWQTILYIGVLTLLAGGALAVVVALFTGQLGRVFSNSFHMVSHSVLKSLSDASPHIEAPAVPSGKLPYAIAIAAGTLPYLIYAAMTGKSLFL